LYYCCCYPKIACPYLGISRAFPELWNIPESRNSVNLGKSENSGNSGIQEFINFGRVGDPITSSSGNI
jgi:hypothetical protein